MNLLSDEKMMSMSERSYASFLKEKHEKLLPKDHSKSKQIQRIGKRIAEGAREYLEKNGHEERIEGFDWQFRVLKSDKANAFCMPGGRVVFYTGIMNVARYRDELIAVVMGHEVAHAVARHGNERMSQQLAIRMGASTLSVATSQQPDLTREVLMQAYGVGSRLGALKYSRKHESEADKMGLVFMAEAGYDPRSAVKFWKKMSRQSSGTPPEFLSTHPNHDSRIQDLEGFMPKAMDHYAKGKGS